MSGERNERTATQELPADRFDRLPKSQRVGAHRISGRLRRGWRYVIVGILASAVLITAGIMTLVFTDYHGSETTEQPANVVEDEPEVIAQLDPSATIVVLNGTPTPNLASGVDQVITSENWGNIAFSQNASQRDVAISAVFYTDDANLAAAEGLAEKLGGVSTYKTDNYAEFGVQLIVLLGEDYAGPGFDEAAAITAQLGGAEGDTTEE